MTQRRAVLLIGPTGSGKSPLGDVLAQRGLGPQQLVHFDFGAQLRLVAANSELTPELEPWERGVVEDVLERGRLLEDDAFSIAQKIWRQFLQRHAVEPAVAVVLNGLPRHVGQAKGIQSWVQVVCVIVLTCGLDEILARIASNVGGDRTGRLDDSRLEIERKCAVFEERTAPLVAFYRDRAVPIHRLEVTRACGPDALYRKVARLGLF